jgi:RNA polymerase sigma-70 factor, ECF subfamily
MACFVTEEVSSPEQNVSDRSLLRRFEGGDEEAATALYRRYARRIHALVKAQCAAKLGARLEPADLVQSIFGKFFQNASKGFYEVPEGEELWGLLLVIALNKVRDKATYFYAAKRDAGTLQEVDAEVPDPRGEDEAFALLQMVVREAVAELPPAHQAIMELRLQGYEVAEIAERTQRSKRTVERVLQDFRHRLAPLIRDES